MAMHVGLKLGVALSATSLLLTLSAMGCATETKLPAAPDPGGQDQMVVSGRAQPLQNGNDGSLQVAARWSTEADVPGVYIQIDDVSSSGPNSGSFDLDVAQPPAEVMEQGHDADYMYTSAGLVLLDNEALVDGWVEAQELADSEVGQSLYNIYYVDRDIPASATGHFGIGPVSAGFHLIERQPDLEVLDKQGRVSGGIAVWKEVPLDTEIEILVGTDGNPTPEDF